MYIPTQQELESIWFRKDDWWNMVHDTKHYKITIDALWSYIKCIIWFKNHMGHISNKQDFYPKSKDHILQILLAFTFE